MYASPNPYILSTVSAGLVIFVTRTRICNNFGLWVLARWIPCVYNQPKKSTVPVSLTCLCRLSFWTRVTRWSVHRHALAVDIKWQWLRHFYAQILRFLVILVWTLEQSGFTPYKVTLPYIWLETLFTKWVLFKSLKFSLSSQLWFLEHKVKNHAWSLRYRDEWKAATRATILEPLPLTLEAMVAFLGVSDGPSGFALLSLVWVFTTQYSKASKLGVQQLLNWVV